MGLDIQYTFPKTRPRPKSDLIARAAEVRQLLSCTPGWLVGHRRVGVTSCILPRAFTDAPLEFTRAYYQQGPHDYKTEQRKSSEITLTNLFAMPLPETGISPFQLMSKTKERIDLKHVWEYLMLDLWNNLLRDYSNICSISLRSPVPFKLENDALYMGYLSGTIGDRIHYDLRPDHQIRLNSGSLSLYQAFALHLGALAHIKESEELSHGDYQLRHILFDPGQLLDSFFWRAQAANHMAGRFTLVTDFLTSPSLGVIDIEGSLRQTGPQVREENDVMLKQAREYAAGKGLRPLHFEQAYRDGFDLIEPQARFQAIVDRQYERWGVSVEQLF